MDQANSIKSRLGSIREKVVSKNGPQDVQYLFVCMFINIIRSDVPAGTCMYLLVREVLLDWSMLLCFYSCWFMLTYVIQVQKHWFTAYVFVDILVPSVSFG